MLAAAMAAAAVAAEPRTWVDVDRDLNAWLSEKLRADFEAHGTKDAAWAGAYKEFLAAWAETTLDGYPPAAMERLEVRAKELVAAGCDDPAFSLFRGGIDLARGRPQEALAAFRRLADVQRAGYPALYARYALLWSREAKAAIDPATARLPQPDTALHEVTLAIARDTSFADGRQWIYLRTFLPVNDALLAAAAEQFAKPDSGVDPWITAMVVGRDHVRRAGEARGTGFANTVTPQGWKGLGEHLAAAREQLTRAHELHPEWPEAASEMISVSLGEGSDEERLWFDRAVAAQFDHEPSYDRMLLQTLLPRWGGSHEEMIEFGHACLASGRFDTNVPYYGYGAAVAVGAELAAVRDVMAIEGVYDDCVRVCRGYFPTAPTPEVARVWHARLAVVHWAAGRHMEACEELDGLRDELAPQPLQEFRVRAEDVIGESRLLGGPDGAAFAAAEALIEDGKVEEALAAYRPLAARDGLAPAARRIVESRLKTLENAAALGRYEWVDLQPPADLTGWRRVFGEWKVEGDGTLVGTIDERGRAKLLCEAELGQDVEVTAECDLIERPTAQKLWFQVTFLLAHDAGEDERNAAVGIRLDAPSRMVQIAPWGVRGLPVNAPDAIKEKVGLKAKNTLRIVLWDGRLSVFVNGKKVVDKVALPPEWLEGGGLGIVENTVVRIRKLRARKLDKPPDDM